MISKLKSNITLAGMLDVQPTEDPARGAGARWRMIRPQELISQLQSAVKQMGWKLTGEARCAISPNRLEMAFSQAVTGEGLPEGAAVGLMDSNNMKRSVTMCSGFWEIGRDAPYCGHTWQIAKHNGDFNLTHIFALALDDFQANITADAADLGTLGRAKIDKLMVQNLLFTAGRCDVIPWSRVPLVEEYLQGDRAADLYRAVAQVVGQGPGVHQMEHLCKFREILTLAVGAGSMTPARS